MLQLNTIGDKGRPEVLRGREGKMLGILIKKKKIFCEEKLLIIYQPFL